MSLRNRMSCSCADVDSFQCTGTFKPKTGKIGAPPKEFAAVDSKGQQSNGQAATAEAAASNRRVTPPQTSVSSSHVQHMLAGHALHVGRQT